MNHKHTLQNTEVKAKEGGEGLPYGDTKIKPTINNIGYIITNLNDVDDKAKKKAKHIQEGYQNGWNVILHDSKSKKPNWLGMKASNYKVDLQLLLNEFFKNPYGYGYGVVIGPQLDEKFSLVAIDVDIDTPDCKERISKEIEELLNKHGIKYFKEITKSERIHYYIILDKITDKIASISKLPYLNECFKLKYTKTVPGEIELFTKKNKYIIVYDGDINDKDPFFTQRMQDNANSYQLFENFLDEWISKYKEEESKREIKDNTIKPLKNNAASSIPTPELKEVFKIFREYRLFNGWEIDKLYSAYCVMNNIPEEQIIEDLKDIWEEEYNERLTKNLIENTQRRYRAGSILPGLGSIYHYINEALKDKRLEEDKKELLKKVLRYIANKGYSNYKMPRYLKTAENVILDLSIEQEDKDGNVYYEESYFIEQDVNGVKKVMYVNIVAGEEEAIYKRHKLKKLRAVGIKADIIRLVKDGKLEEYEYFLNDKIIYKPSFHYTKIDDVIYEIGLISMKYEKYFDVNLYKRYLSKKIEGYIREKGDPQPCVIGRSTGWSNDLKHFYHYALNDEYHELHQDHALYKYNKNLIIDKDKQHEIVKSILKEGKLLAVLLTASVSSLFIKPFNIPGVTIIISGNSSAGKTTSSLIATSLFYYSDDILLNAQTSKAGVELTISSLNSLPVLIDEGSLADINFSLENLIFMVSSGKGKTRGKKDLTVDFKELKSNVFWTTEKTDIDELRKTGAFRRTLYLLVSSWDDLTSLFQNDDRINERYAGCGIDYIKFLINNMDEIKESFKEQTQELKTKYKEIATIALNLYSGLILLEAFYNTKFNELRKTINKLLNEAKARFIDSRDNVVIQFRDYIESITYQRFNVINEEDRDGKLNTSTSRYETYGEYNKIEGVYYLNARGLKEIADKLGKNKQLLLKELEKAGVLIDKNVTYYTKVTRQRIKVHKIKFSEMVEPETIEDEEETEEKTNYEELDIPF
jgi:hypothetical protein